LRAEFDQSLLAAALAENDHHRSRAAEQLGVCRNTLTRKLGSSRRRKKNKPKD
jgi:two-component system nitrogen regulation response regulator GlnG